MKKISKEVLLGKYVKPILTVLAVVGVVAAIIIICELYSYLALNVWAL